MADYTYKDIIIDPNDPRLEVGEKYYYADSPKRVLEHTKSGDYCLGTLDSVNKGDTAVPFMVDSGSTINPWACLIRKKETSYAERQAKWVADNDIKKGDKVRVIRKADHNEDGWGSLWNPEMDEAVGKVGRVCSISRIFRECGIEVNVPDVGPYLYPYFVLEKVEQKYVPFNFNDKEDRAKLRGAWIRNVESGLEYQVICIGSALVFVHNGDFNAGSLLDQFVFLDGTPCGKLVEE